MLEVAYSCTMVDLDLGIVDAWQKKTKTTTMNIYMNVNSI